MSAASRGSFDRNIDGRKIEQRGRASLVGLCFLLNMMRRRIEQRIFQLLWFVIALLSQDEADEEDPEPADCRRASCSH